MITRLSLLLLLGCLMLCFSCSENTSDVGSNQQDNTTTPSAGPNPSNKETPSKPTSMTDHRDGEVYAIVAIGRQTWMAENLRFETNGSMLNPENPSKSYGRLYLLHAAQTACPEGWHLPSDSEWDEVEIAHGMPRSFIGKGGWRGTHAPAMRSTHAWEEKERGRNELGFNVLPAGYYFSGDLGEEEGMQGLGYSAAFWSSLENDVARARFLFGARKFVNKWDDKNNDSGSGLSCRCVKD